MTSQFHKHKKIIVNSLFFTNIFHVRNNYWKTKSNISDNKKEISKSWDALQKNVKINILQWYKKSSSKNFLNNHFLENLSIQKC